MQAQRTSRVTTASVLTAEGEAAAAAEPTAASSAKPADARSPNGEVKLPPSSCSAGPPGSSRSPTASPKAEASHSWVASHSSISARALQSRSSDSAISLLHWSSLACSLRISDSSDANLAGAWFRRSWRQVLENWSSLTCSSRISDSSDANLAGTWSTSASGIETRRASMAARAPPSEDAFAEICVSPTRR